MFARMPNVRRVRAWYLQGLVVLAGCGRVGFSTIDAIDAASQDAAPASDCWSSWTSGTPRFTESSPVRVTIDAITTAKNPFLTEDRTTLYFSSSAAGGDSGNDFWRATRESEDTFVDAKLVEGALNSEADDGRLELLPDGTIGVLSSMRESTNYHLWLATRDSPAAAFMLTRLSLLDSSAGEKDPHFSSDGARLYFSSDSKSMHVAVRSGATFHAATVVPGMDNVQGVGDPNLSPDELAIVFSKQQPQSDKNDLYLATRSSTDVSFDLTIALGQLNSTEHNDQDAFVTRDGCELWFASARSGNFGIYVATIAH